MYFFTLSGFIHFFLTQVVDPGTDGGPDVGSEPRRAAAAAGGATAVGGVGGARRGPRLLTAAHTKFVSVFDLSGPSGGATKFVAASAIQASALTSLQYVPEY